MARIEIALKETSLVYASWKQLSFHGYRIEKVFVTWLLVFVGDGRDSLRLVSVSSKFLWSSRW